MQNKWDQPGSNNEITIPNCTKNSQTLDNIKAKDIRLALTKGNLISHDLLYLQEKFGFSEEDMQSVPQDPIKYLREISKIQHSGHLRTRCYTNSSMNIQKERQVKLEVDGLSFFVSKHTDTR